MNKISKYILNCDMSGYGTVLISYSKKAAKEEFKELYNISDSNEIEVREVFEFGDFISLEEDN